MQSIRESKIRLLILRDEKERRVCERSYYEFFKKSWKVLEPETPLVDNWHIKYVCDALQAEIERIAERRPKTKDMILNEPPRSTKSYKATICLAPWAWTQFPWLKFINSSHALELSTEHSTESRRLIQSDWYQRKWSTSFQLTTDQNVKTYFKNNRGGRRYSTSTDKGAIGRGADVITVDDPLNPKKIASEPELKAANKHVAKDLVTRLNDQTVGLRMLVMQRLVQDDPTGHLLGKNPNRYNHICMPAEINLQDEKSIENVRPRSLLKFYRDGLFFPGRFSKEYLQNIREDLGEVEYAGQFLQRPSPAEGNIFKRKNWKFYDERPKKFDVIIQSWDMAFKDKKTSDYVAGLVLGRLGANIYLLARIHRKMSFTQTIGAVVALTQQFPNSRKKLIEDAANGPAIVNMLKDEIQGIDAVPVEGSKVARAHAVSYLQDCGNCYLPNPEKNIWVNDFMEELEAFPNGKNDDQVDAYTQGLYELSGGVSQSARLKALLNF